MLELEITTIHDNLRVSEPLGPHVRLCSCGPTRQVVPLPSPDRLARIPPSVLESLNWWKSPGNVCQGVPFVQPSPTKLVVNNTSLLGWGAHLVSFRMYSLWLEQEASLHINVLELQAIHNTCHAFRDCSRHNHPQYHHSVLCEQTRGSSF